LTISSRVVSRFFFYMNDVYYHLTSFDFHLSCTLCLVHSLSLWWLRPCIFMNDSFFYFLSFHFYHCLFEPILFIRWSFISMRLFFLSINYLAADCSLPFVFEQFFHVFFRIDFNNLPLWTSRPFFLSLHCGQSIIIKKPGFHLFSSIATMHFSWTSRTFIISLLISTICLFAPILLLRPSLHATYQSIFSQWKATYYLSWKKSFMYSPQLISTTYLFDSIAHQMISSLSSTTYLSFIYFLSIDFNQPSIWTVLSLFVSRLFLWAYRSSVDFSMDE
jgi:hypothetical protein